MVAQSSSRARPRPPAGWSAASRSTAQSDSGRGCTSGENRASRTAGLRCTDRLSNTTTSPGRSVGASTCSMEARKLTPSIGPSKTAGAVRPVTRSAASKVVVCQHLSGACSVACTVFFRRQPSFVTPVRQIVGSRRRRQRLATPPASDPDQDREPRPLRGQARPSATASGGAARSTRQAVDPRPTHRILLRHQPTPCRP